MPLFHIDNDEIVRVRATNFDTERRLQSLVEQNLPTLFDCRFIASEFSTGSAHGGRIDTLALSEDNNPVVIEYKKVESSELVNQSLYYLSWVTDHRGDFQVAAQRKLGDTVEIDWGEVRVICLAPGYKKYDLHAVEMMGASIELWQYRLFEDGTLYLEEVYRRRTTEHVGQDIADGKNPVMVAAGKKAAATRLTGSYKVSEHLDKAKGAIRSLAESLRESILEIDESVEESPKKCYIAYKTTQNFVCVEIRQSKILLSLNLIRRSSRLCLRIPAMSARSGITAQEVWSLH